MDPLKQILNDARPYWRRATVGYICMLATTGLDMVTPWLIKEAIDVGLTRGDRQFLGLIALLILGISVARGLFFLEQRYVQQTLAQVVSYDLRNKVYDKLQRLSFAYHDRAESGQLLTRATADVVAVQGFISSGLFDFVAMVLLSIGIAVILFTTDLKLALLSLIPVPFIGVLAIYLGLRVRPLSRAVQRRYSEMSNALQENLIGVQVVRAFVREQFEIEKFGQASMNLVRARIRRFHIWARYFPAMLSLIALPLAIVLWVGGQRAIAGQITIGTVVAFGSYVTMLATPVRQLGNLVNQATDAMVSRERIHEVLSASTDVKEKVHARPLPPIKGWVRFNDVSFTYQGARFPAVRDVSFEAAPGQVVALLGHTGSGKSTLVNLIPRFYEVNKGTITVDGVDIREVTLESLRCQIGFVLQETFLFSTTVQENIAFGRPETSLEEIIEAAKAARAHDFIMSLPEGYDTVVGERGLTLSGGQRQRIAIARALVLQPPILILDDSTSSVDMHTEHLIQQALETLMKGRTSFVIAQRLTTVLNADQILVLHEGHIAERGVHSELLVQDGLYREIYDLQLRDQEKAAQLAA